MRRELMKLPMLNRSMSIKTDFSRASTFAVAGGILCVLAWGTSIFYDTMGQHLLDQTWETIYDTPIHRNEFGHRTVGYLQYRTGHHRYDF